jgi:hypothetical protein
VEGDDRQAAEGGLVFCDDESAFGLVEVMEVMEVTPPPVASHPVTGHLVTRHPLTSITSIISITSIRLT